MLNKLLNLDFINSLSAVLILILCFSLIVWAMVSLVQAVLNPKTAEAYRVVGTTRVQPNGTLWTIAVEHYPNIDPREAVFHIRQVNEGIDPGRLQIGQEILLPEVR